jgi:hypothetical protein
MAGPNQKEIEKLVKEINAQLDAIREAKFSVASAEGLVD